MEANEKELSICSIYHSPQTRRLLELNRDFAARMNRHNKWVWIAGDNTPANAPSPIDETKFTPVRGADMAELKRRYPRRIADEKGFASFHLAAATQKCIQAVRTRWLVIHDNDLFVVRPDWMSEIIGYMEGNNLGFFGVTWPAYRHTTYRYFPCPHFFFVDLDSVDKECLYFYPSLEQISVPRFLRFRGMNFLKKWQRIGKSRDGGYFLYRQFFRSGIRFEYAQNVFRSKKDASRTFGIAENIIRRILPDQWLFAPKRRGYYTETAFKDADYPDMRGFGAEEFFWRGSPFAFHLYKAKARWFGNDFNAGIERLSRVLDIFASRAGR
ncbi:MAG: glycosyltransferase [Patescibacteria group bacterium]